MLCELCGKNCVGGAPEGNMRESEKYIMMEVFNTSDQLRRAVSRIDKSHCMGISLVGPGGPRVENLLCINFLLKKHEEVRLGIYLSLHGVNHSSLTLSLSQLS